PLRVVGDDAAVDERTHDRAEALPDGFGEAPLGRVGVGEREELAGRPVRQGLVVVDLVDLLNGLAVDALAPAPPLRRAQRDPEEPPDRRPPRGPGQPPWPELPAQPDQRAGDQDQQEEQERTEDLDRRGDGPIQEPDHRGTARTGSTGDPVRTARLTAMSSPSVRIRVSRCAAASPPAMVA